MCVDDPRPPYSFGQIHGVAAISEDPRELLDAATRTGGRYLGADRAEEFGRRSGVPGELVVRIKPTKVRKAFDVAARRSAAQCKDTNVSASPGPYAVGVVLAAGTGTRVGADGNKAYLRVAGRSMVCWSLDALSQVPEIARIVLVVRRGETELARETVTRELPSATVEFVEGGDSRHASEFNVLRHLAADIESGAIDVVLIHDAARPVAGPDMFETALSVAREFGGAIPAVPVPDVVTAGAHLEPAAGGASLVRVQTPQAFRAAALLQAYRTAASQEFEGTDTSSCVEAFTDVEVRTFRGEQRNLKVTYANDIAVAERLLTDREGPAAGSL